MENISSVWFINTIFTCPMSHTSQYWQKWSPVEEGTLPTMAYLLIRVIVGSKLICKFYKKIFFFLAAGGFSNMLSWLLLFHQQISGVGAEIEAAWLCCASDRLHLHHSNKTLPWYNSKQKYKIQIHGAAVGVRLQVDHSHGPFRNLPKHQMLQYFDLSQHCQHSFGHHQQVKETGGLK